MGAELRVYRRRIKSVESTKKITKAMELIAASRIVKAQARMNAAKPYAKELSGALARLGGDPTLAHPMFTGVDNPRRAGILLITSDRGLAGGYNANAIRTANELADRLGRNGMEIDRFVIGRKGVAFYRFRHVQLVDSWTGFSEQPNFQDARGATDTVVAALSATSDGEAEDGRPGIDELWVVYTRFVNSVSQTPTAVRVSPVRGATDESEAEGEEAEEEGSESQAQYEFEPEPAGLVAALLPRYISSRIFSALLESAASESAARRRAMKSASDNATDLIRTYTRLANQARQAEITQEISEIVGGADALAAAGSEE
ncbi:MAG TPA: F0F1 ATP synthase subunit gamma [Jatrophihabitans sp.]|jgi:F-type H+-transporting ATPase subunit gamma|nr:F0F1 ATP synthase subunit gamma [Jatrophihabitans sp.]